MVPPLDEDGRAVPEDKDGKAPVKEKRQRCRKIKLEFLYGWADRHDFMTHEEIDEILKVSTRDRLRSARRVL